MAEIKDNNFPSSEILSQLGEQFSKLGDKEKQSQINKTNAAFEIHLKNQSPKEGVWTIDLKKEGSVYKGPAKEKADAILTLDEETFKNISEGKSNGQKAFMSGKLKVKGNMMLATKLDGILGQRSSKL